MFFPERIIGISPSDKVLEIGPGSAPHPRSDVLLEKRFTDVDEQKEQRGNTPEIRTSKTIVYYDGDAFPFGTGEFDYVICSHVLEHVDNLEVFLAELFRVARRGYIEYPTVFYEYLYNFGVHKNILKFDGKTLWFLKKSDTPINYFEPVQAFFLDSLNKGYSSLVEELKDVMFEGFEWRESFMLKQSGGIEQYCRLSEVLRNREAQRPSIINRFKALLARGS